MAFNRWGYRARVSSVRRLGLDIRGKRVLDVGAGTGFWCDYWHGAGAASVAGIDLTAASVKYLLGQYPGDAFLVHDISDAIPGLGQFDLICAVDVLLHITNDERYRAALRNMRECAASDGRLLLVEPLAKAPTPFVAGSHSRARESDQVCRWLDEAGWRMVELHPTVSVLGNPIEQDSLPIYSILRLFWAATALLARLESTGYLTGAALYPIDRWLSSRGWGFSSKLLLAEAR